jgi:hypothetical protein
MDRRVDLSVTAETAAAASVESAKSAISWAAIIAGAFVAAASSLLLLALGSGLGLASVSPWPNRGVSATAFTIAAGIWLIVVQWLSAGLGGYLTGRLRTRWVGTHTHEVFFRDTAHGFVTWAVATLVAAAVIAAAGSTVLTAGTRAAATIGSESVQLASDAIQDGTPQSGTAAAGSAVGAYDVDLLFRGERASADTDAHAQALHILANGVRTGQVPPPDRAYLASLVSARAGISQADAERRVDQVINAVDAAALKLRQAADAGRKAASAAAIFTALSMLIGAFIACVAAALGGGQRDEQPL